MSPQTKEREPLTVLKTYPAFQALRGKAEIHEWQFRPNEARRLQEAGTLGQVLDSRTESAWNSLRDCLASGMNRHEAEEIALPHILLPSESEDDEETDEMTNSTNSATPTGSALNSTKPSAATPARRLSGQEAAEITGRSFLDGMQKRLDAMKRGEKVREL